MENLQRQLHHLWWSTGSKVEIFDNIIDFKSLIQIIKIKRKLKINYLWKWASLRKSTSFGQDSVQLLQEWLVFFISKEFTTVYKFIHHFEVVRSLRWLENNFYSCINVSNVFQDIDIYRNWAISSCWVNFNGINEIVRRYISDQDGVRSL